MKAKIQFRLKDVFVAVTLLGILITACIDIRTRIFFYGLLGFLLRFYWRANWVVVGVLAAASSVLLIISGWLQLGPPYLLIILVMFWTFELGGAMIAVLGSALLGEACRWIAINRQSRKVDRKT